MLSIEIYVDDVPKTLDLFRDCFGFRASRTEPTFAIAWLGTTRLLVNQIDKGGFTEPNPILREGARAHRGAGLELVISVPDLDAAYQRVATRGVSALGPIVDQEWGVRDFRFLTDEGFYVRVTEPDDEVLNAWEKHSDASD